MNMGGILIKTCLPKTLIIYLNIFCCDFVTKSLFYYQDHVTSPIGQVWWVCYLSVSKINPSGTIGRDLRWTLMAFARNNFEIDIYLEWIVWFKFLLSGYSDLIFRSIRCIALICAAGGISVLNIMLESDILISYHIIQLLFNISVLLHFFSCFSAALKQHNIERVRQMPGASHTGGRFERLHETIKPKVAMIRADDTTNTIREALEDAVFFYK